MIGNGKIQKGPAGQIITGSIQENLFILGFSFSYANRSSIAAGANLDLIFDATQATAIEQIIFTPLLYVATNGPVIVDLYSDPVYTGGSTVKGGNRRQTASNLLSESNIILGAAVSDPGTLLPLPELIAASSSFFGDNGGSNVPGLPFEIDKTKKYLIRLTNQNGSAALVRTAATWFEVPAGF